MRKQLVYELHALAEQIANHYSNHQRANNYNNETFAVTGIEPTSETTATITFLKSSGKLALAFAFYKKNRWDYFFPTESHIIGMQKLANALNQIDQYNFKKNGCDGSKQRY